MTNFYVTAKGVYFKAPRPADGSTAVQLFRFADNKVETIVPLASPIWFGVSVAPDERSILYTQVESRREQPDAGGAPVLTTLLSTLDRIVRLEIQETDT
jgi:hypothetical protein